MCRSLFIGVMLLMVASLARAQTSVEGRLTGTVRDEQGGLLPGAEIALEGQRATTTTDENGAYRLANLSPGEYWLLARFAGFADVRHFVVIQAGSNATLNLVMNVGSVDETIEVRHETPLLETQSGGHTVNISGELLRSMPLSERREWFGAMTLAPGVTTAEWVSNEKLFSVHGADSNANIVQVDGADVSPALASGVRYVGLNTDSIEDIQIKTAGVDASAPLGIGGIVNIATSSGTNTVKGAATFFVQPLAWNASNTPGGTSSTVDQRQLDLSLGAPIVKDRLWAFGSYRYTDATTGVSRTAAQLDALRLLVPQFEPFGNSNTAHFWFAKLNAQLHASHQLSGFYQRDVNPVAFADALAEHLRREATGGSGLSLRWLGAWSNAFTSRVGVSYNDKRRDGQPPDGDGPLRRVYQSTITSAGRLVGNGRIADLGPPVSGWGAQPNSKLTISVDATVFRSSRLGSHEVQTGLYLQPRLRNGSRTFYVNGGFVFEESVLRNAGTADRQLVPFHRMLVDGTVLTNSDREGQDYGFYVQDAWRPTSRLTINVGVRVDHLIWQDALFDVVSQRSTEIGPRLSANYLVTSDAANVVRAHVVRVHDQPAQNATSVGTSALAQRDEYDLDLNGTFETAFDTPATLALTPGRSVDPDLHQSFVQEWGTGYSRQFGGGVTARADVVHREYRHRPTLVETNGLYDGSVFVGYRDEGFNEIYQITNNVWNTPVYRSIEFAVTKRSARVQGIGSYVRQWRHIDGTWQPRDPASFIQPNAFENSRGIGSPGGSISSTGDANSLSGIHMSQRAAASGQWQDHVVRAGVSVMAPWQLLLAMNYTFQSGIWSGPVIAQVAADPTFGPAQVTLSNGRRVTNPLATALRFAFPTRTEGQLTTPRLHVWNARVGRRFTWAALVLDAGIDVFNITNNGADASFELGANQLYNPAYGITTFRQLPRSAQVVIRASF